MPLQLVFGDKRFRAALVLALEWPFITMRSLVNDQVSSLRVALAAARNGAFVRLLRKVNEPDEVRRDRLKTRTHDFAV